MISTGFEQMKCTATEFQTPQILKPSLTEPQSGCKRHGNLCRNAMLLTGAADDISRRRLVDVSDAAAGVDEAVPVSHGIRLVLLHLDLA